MWGWCQKRGQQKSHESCWYAPVYVDMGGQIMDKNPCNIDPKHGKEDLSVFINGVPSNSWHFWRVVVISQDDKKVFNFLSSMSSNII